MPLFERRPVDLLEEAVRKRVIDALADLLLETLQDPTNREETSDEPEDHA
jgi:hypothetical protein